MSRPMGPAIVAGLAMGMVSCTSLPETLPSDQLFEVDRPLYFDTNSGEQVVLVPGVHLLEEGEGGVLLVDAAGSIEPVQLAASEITHDEDLAAPFAICGPTEDEFHLALLLPGGRGLDARGSTDPFRSRDLRFSRMSRASLRQKYSQLHRQQVSRPMIRFRPPSGTRISTVGTRPSYQPPANSPVGTRPPPSTGRPLRGRPIATASDPETTSGRPSTSSTDSSSSTQVGETPKANLSDAESIAYIEKGLVRWWGELERWRGSRFLTPPPSMQSTVTTSGAMRLRTIQPLGNSGDAVRLQSIEDCLRDWWVELERWQGVHFLEPVPQSTRLPAARVSALQALLVGWWAALEQMRGVHFLPPLS